MIERIQTEHVKPIMTDSINQSGKAPSEPLDIIAHLLEHAKDDMKLAELTASRAGLWHVAEDCRNIHVETVKAISKL